MPLTKKGKKIYKNMQKKYGKAKGENIFYASINKGTIAGVHKNKKRQAMCRAIRKRNNG